MFLHLLTLPFRPNAVLSDISRSRHVARRSVYKNGQTRCVVGPTGTALNDEGIRRSIGVRCCVRLQRRRYLISFFSFFLCNSCPMIAVVCYTNQRRATPFHDSLSSDHFWAGLPRGLSPSTIPTLLSLSIYCHSFCRCGRRVSVSFVLLGPPPCNGVHGLRTLSHSGLVADFVLPECIHNNNYYYKAILMLIPLRTYVSVAYT